MCVCACLCTHFISFLFHWLIRLSYSSHKRPTRIAIYPHLSLFLLITWMRSAECNVCYVSEKVIYCSFLGKFQWTRTRAQNCVQCKDEKPASKRLMEHTKAAKRFWKKGKRNWNREEKKRENDNNTSRLTRKKEEVNGLKSKPKLTWNGASVFFSFSFSSTFSFEKIDCA